MLLTTTEQLKQVQAGETLFLINPFGNGDQSRVKIQRIIVASVESDHFEAHLKWTDSDEERKDRKFFQDMIRGPKYVYTNLAEAESKLAEVRTGIHSYEVKRHHNSCGSYRV